MIKPYGESMKIKYKKTSINETAFKSFSSNLWEYVGMTSIPKWPSFTVR